MSCRGFFPRNPSQYFFPIWHYHCKRVMQGLQKHVRWTGGLS